MEDNNPQMRTTRVIQDPRILMEISTNFSQRGTREKEGVSANKKKNQFQEHSTENIVPREFDRINL